MYRTNHPQTAVLSVVLSFLTLKAAPAPQIDQAETSGQARIDPGALDLREPRRLGAQAIMRRLDPGQDFRPWFLLRGHGGVPVAPEHSNWDLGDMTGRYLESLIQARHMGVTSPDLSEAEARLGRYLLKLL